MSAVGGPAPAEVGTAAPEAASTPERVPLGFACRYCGSGQTWVEWRWEAKPWGTFSLAGAQVKTVARQWPYAVCDGCGHTSRGKQES